MNLDVAYVCIFVAIILLLVYAYLSSDYYYIHVVLKTAFEQLTDGDDFRELNPDINWKVINMEIDGYINNKKIVTNLPKYETANSAHARHEFEYKNTLAAYLNNVVVFDIDSNEPLVITGASGMDDKPIDQYLPKDTVIAKSPHGYHYYFYNDTDTPISCYVGLMMNGVKYPIDLLTGRKQLIFMPPTRIETACYRWINPPTTHKIAPISQHARILDLFAYTKEFEIRPETPNMCVSNAVPHLLCIVWEFHIIYELKNKCASTAFEKLHVNEHEMLYRIQTTYYLFMKHAPLKNYTAPQCIHRIEKSCNNTASPAALCTCVQEPAANPNAASCNSIRARCTTTPNTGCRIPSCGQNTRWFRPAHSPPNQPSPSPATFCTRSRFMGWTMTATSS